MEFLMDGLELASIDLSVDLGGGDGGVSQKFLDDAEIGPSRKKVCGKRVPELVGMDRFLKTCPTSIQPDELPDSGWCEGMSPNREENLGSGLCRDKIWSADGEVGFQGIKGRPPHRDQSCLVSFSGHPDHAPLLIQVFKTDRAGFCDSKSAGIEKL